MVHVFEPQACVPLEVFSSASHPGQHETASQKLDEMQAQVPELSGAVGGRSSCKGESTHRARQGSQWLLFLQKKLWLGGAPCFVKFSHQVIPKSAILQVGPLSLGDLWPELVNPSVWHLRRLCQVQKAEEERNRAEKAAAEARSTCEAKLSERERVSECE